MSTTTLHVVLQALSALAVTGAMIFTGLQFRGWRTAQHVANFTRLVELQLELRKMLVEDPTLAVAGADVPPGMEPDKIRGHFYNLMQVSLFEIAWFIHQRGQLPHEHFASWAMSMAEVARRPAFQAMWLSDRAKLLDGSFRQYMTALLTDSENNGR